MYLARTFTELLPTVEVDHDYKEHFIGAYNMRADELDMPISRLAMFLDPRFKAAACNDPAAFKEMVKLVSVEMPS